MTHVSSVFPLVFFPNAGKSLQFLFCCNLGPAYLRATRVANQLRIGSSFSYLGVRIRPRTTAQPGHDLRSNAHLSGWPFPLARNRSVAGKPIGLDALGESGFSWPSTWFGTRGSEGQILSLPPFIFKQIHAFSSSRKFTPYGKMRHC